MNTSPAPIFPSVDFPASLDVFSVPLCDLNGDPMPNPSAFESNQFGLATQSPFRKVAPSMQQSQQQQQSLLQNRRRRRRLADVFRSRQQPHETQLPSTIDESLLDIETVFQLHACYMAHRFQECWTKVQTDVKKPNVLLMGLTGAGKSSIVNAVFGLKMAEVGNGAPITQHYTKVELPNHPVNLVDSKGLEHGEHHNFIHSTKKFLSETNDQANPADRVHVIWYIINTAIGRFQDFERDLCCNVLKEFPILFIMNKADISTEEARVKIKQIIHEMNMSHCIGILETVAQTQADISCNIEFCPKCGSEDITIKSKQMLCICEECGDQIPFGCKSGLESAIQTTLEHRHLYARDAFTAAQGISFSMRSERSIAAVREYQQSTNMIRNPRALKERFSRLLAHISHLWGFHKHSSLYSQIVSEEFTKGLPFTERLLLLFSRNEDLLMQTIAIGILWGRGLRDLTICLSSNYALTNKPPEDVYEHWDEVRQIAFQDFTPARLAEIVDAFHKSGINTAFES